MTFFDDVAEALAEGPVTQELLLDRLGVEGPLAPLARAKLQELVTEGRLHRSGGNLSVPPALGVPDPGLVEEADELAHVLSAHRDALRRHGFNTPDIRAILAAVVASGGVRR